MAAHIAVDLGATSGRVVLGTVEGGRVALDEVARFPNGPVERGGALHWDLDGLEAQVRAGVLAAARRAPAGTISIGIDAWAVDYGLVDADERLVGPAFHYRDGRTADTPERVHRSIAAERLFEITGVQPLPFTTIFQLAAERPAGPRSRAAVFRLVPDLIAARLGPGRAAEITNASTTGLLDVRSRSWSDEIIAAVGLDRRLFPPLVEPGTIAGPLTGDAGGRSAVVVDVASHDTASAVTAIPAQGRHWAFISSGTWSIVGVEVEAPATTAQVAEQRFGNELGIDGTVRLVRNVMGLWLLDESIRQWQREGEATDLAALLDEAAQQPDGGPVFDPDHPSLLAPGDMPARIRSLPGIADGTGPSRGAFVRCVLDSLAAKYAASVSAAEVLAGRSLDVVHVVGGGARNALLCQLTADACDRPVVAGPVEATALGNVLVQARAAGAVNGDLADLRRIVAASVTTTRYAPSDRAAPPHREGQRWG